MASSSTWKKIQPSQTRPTIHTVDSLFSSIPTACVPFYPKIIFQYNNNNQNLLFESCQLSSFNKRFNFNYVITLEWFLDPQKEKVDDSQNLVQVQELTNENNPAEPYTPHDDDIGLDLILKVKMFQKPISNNCTEKSFDQAFGYVFNGYQCSSFERNWTNAKNYKPGTSPGQEITVLSFNILHDQYASISSHSLCPSWSLERNFRRKKQLDECLRLLPDIICFQEIPVFDYARTIGEELRRSNFEGTFSSKNYSRQKDAYDYGTATFVNTRAATVLEHYTFNQRNEERKFITNEERNTDLSKNDLQITLVKSNRSNSPFVVVNAHLAAFNSEYQFLGILILMHHLRSFLNTKKLNIRETPIIFCGDLNSEPGSPLIRTILSGAINTDVDVRKFKNLNVDAINRNFGDLAFRSSFGDFTGTGLEINHTSLSNARSLTSDYIFYRGNSIRPKAVLNPILYTDSDAIKHWSNVDDESLLVAPSILFSSDHFLVGVKFRMGPTYRPGPELPPIQKFNSYSPIQVKREVSFQFLKSFRSRNSQLTVRNFLNDLIYLRTVPETDSSFVSEVCKLMTVQLLSLLHFEFGHVIVDRNGSNASRSRLFQRLNANLQVEIRSYIYYRRNHMNKSGSSSHRNAQFRPSELMSNLFNISPLHFRRCNFQIYDNPNRVIERNKQRDILVRTLYALNEPKVYFPRNAEKAIAFFKKELTQQSQPSNDINFLFPNCRFAGAPTFNQNFRRTGVLSPETKAFLDGLFDRHFEPEPDGLTIGDILYNSLEGADRIGNLNFSVFKYIASLLYDKLLDLFLSFFPNLGRIPGRITDKRVTRTDHMRYEEFNNHHRFWLCNQLLFMYCQENRDLSAIFERLLRLHTYGKKTDYPELIMEDVSETLRLFFCTKLFAKSNGNVLPCFSFNRQNMIEIYRQRFLYVENGKDLVLRPYSGLTSPSDIYLNDDRK